MYALIAHLRLHGRHRRQVTIGGLSWKYCVHRSHRLSLWCWRFFVYDGYCDRHNESCYYRCPEKT